MNRAISQQTPAEACPDVTPNNEVSIVAVRGADGIMPYVQRLEELAEQSADRNVFYEPWMLLPALDAYGSGNDLIFVMAMATDCNDGSTIVCGFFPFVERTVYRGFPTRHLALWRYPHCYLSTPLVHRKFVGESLQALLAWFQDQSRCSLLEWHTLAADSAAYQCLQDLVSESSLVTWERSFERAFLRTEGDAVAYMAECVPAKVRHEHRRRHRRLSEIGDVQWTELSADSVIDEWIEDFLRLEASGWKGRSGTALDSCANDRDFFCSLVTEGARRKKLRILALRLDDRPIAMIVVLLSGDGGYTFKHAFDETYRHCGPGVLLFLELIQRAHDSQGFRWLDSCTVPDNAILNRLFSDRRPMCNLIVAKPYTLGASAATCWRAFSRAGNWLAGASRE